MSPQQYIYNMLHYVNKRGVSGKYLFVHSYTCTATRMQMHAGQLLYVMLVPCALHFHKYLFIFSVLTAYTMHRMNVCLQCHDCLDYTITNALFYVVHVMMFVPCARYTFISTHKQTCTYTYRIFSDNNTSFLFFQSVCYWCLYWRRVCDRDCVPYNFNSVELNCQAVFYGYDL